MADVSLTTVALSAAVSIVTGYIGSLLSASRQRRQERRTYGLALLAEVKSIQRGLWRYQARVEAGLDGEEAEWGLLRQQLRLWRHDLSVYAANSGRIGLFSTRAAAETIEFYHRVRWLDARIGELSADASTGADAAGDWLREHREAIRSARQHSRALARLLRREVPITLGEMARGLRRRLLAGLRARAVAADGRRGAG